ncbi:archaeal ATPase family protein [Lyngbya aestuarii BL J]|uniref:Archaeal ATPase family protein n=1 Tax=Lyngbya aestuarii BL J TaxID=1348334 RepID=U7QLY2_9CYAN|nr:NB-ARC domain-containing protein [Lyngbya aestuarii]ERT08125.1 archaeal ATPase family protein [Lyngbya aestuarii BL J]
MTTSTGQLKRSLDQKFLEAENNWNLEQLYTDLTAAKQFHKHSEKQQLTKTEKTMLRGLLCGLSPSEIATELHRSCSGLRVDLSRGLYRYVEALTDQSLGHWKDVCVFLQVGYQRSTHLNTEETPISQAVEVLELIAEDPPQQPLTTSASLTTPSPVKPKKIDWIEAIDVSTFYGRETELTTLKQWIIEDRCRVVAISGIQGVGKTSLASKLAGQIQNEFEYIIWRNLDHAPPFTYLLTDLIQFFSESQTSEHPEEYLISQLFQKLVQSRVSTSNFNQSVIIADGIRTLIRFLQKHRCLIILDNWESLFQPNTLVGHYKEGYQPYGEFLNKMGQLIHQSCLLITSSETPRKVSISTGKNKAFPCLKVGGLKPENAKQILKNEGIVEAENLEQIVSEYNGNPLALQTIGKTIQTVFAGNTTEFIKYPAFFGEFGDRLSRQFGRLSKIEKMVLYKIANSKTDLTLTEICDHFKPPCDCSELVNILSSLEKRSLIENKLEAGQHYYRIDPLINYYLQEVLPSVS